MSQLSNNPIEMHEPGGQVLIITEAAALKIHELLQEEGEPNLCLRISIMGGGCSGFQYQFSFDDQISEEDVVVAKAIPNGEAKVLVDMLSLPYLQGATVDYKNDANGERFVLNNPHAKTTCGCGSSFDV
ncbi:MAG: iron-sulfur cluster assembly accessory family protein [Gammaproteobacteria bacterium]|jgi:iron-sulfur cluster insertion protein|nr:iron-sulfur cluster assembly accessory family protein [Gammaproteobacteria bacterium]